MIVLEKNIGFRVATETRGQSTDKETTTENSENKATQAGTRQYGGAGRKETDTWKTMEAQPKELVDRPKGLPSVDAVLLEQW